MGEEPRRAGPDDAEALTVLRAVMLDAMGQRPPAAQDRHWHEATVSWFGELLLDRERFAAFVVDDPALGVVSCASGSASSGSPVPGDTRRIRGHLFSVATDARARRRGYARACAVAVLAWLDELGVAHTDLWATPDGIELYRSLGFTDRPWIQMRR